MKYSSSHNQGATVSMRLRTAQIRRSFRLPAFFLFLSMLHAVAPAQTLDVTFRYVKNPSENFVRVFVPGTMPPGSSQDWGPNSNGFISPSAPSIMSYDAAIDAYVRTYALNIGSQYQYKFHFHFNQSGSNWQWISDPLNPDITGPDQNSIITITDPFLFEPAFHENNDGDVIGLSMGIFTNSTIENLVYIAGADSTNGLTNIDSNGVFYASFDPPKILQERYKIDVTIDGQSHVYERPGASVVTEQRPANTRLGPNVVQDGVILVVHAPAQPFVQLLLGPTGSVVESGDAMTLKKAANEEDIWWIDIPLSEGEYEYQYLLANGTRIEDPLSRRVRDRKTVISTGSGGVTTADDYVWQSDDYVRPALDTLVIYELHVDDFAAMGSGQGKFSDVIDRLDYLADLGINAIELMPIMEFPGNRSWGYNTLYYAAVESAYGTPLEFKQLVDEAHQRGIAVILDIVWNHMEGNGPLWHIQPDYGKNPYLKTESEVRPNEDVNTYGGRLLDHFTPETQRFVKEVHRIWIEEYRIDGFRFDFTRGIGWTSAQPEFGILGWSSALRDLDLAAYQIAEHLPADPNLINNHDLDAGWHDSFHDRLYNDIHKNPEPSMSTVERQVLGRYEYNNTGQQYSRRTGGVKATVTHDEQSFIQEMIMWAGFNRETALKRDLVYSTLTFTSLGIPMLWQAQELGMQSGWLDDNGNGDWDEEKLAYRPFDWGLLGTEEGQRHLNYYKRLIQLRKRNPALYRGNLSYLYRNSSLRLLAYGFKDETPESNGDEVMVVLNIGNQDRTISDLPWLSSGVWYDVINNGTSFVASNDTLTEFFISANTALVYANAEVTSTANESDPVMLKYALSQNYPNPFNPITTIEFELREASSVRLVIYDLLGHNIRTLVDEHRRPGYYRIQWDGRNELGNPVSSGVYIMRMTAGQFSQFVKLIKMK